MAGLTPLPPWILHSTTRLTHAEAHAQLSTFLENTENNAAYRPDSTLTDRGPQSGSNGLGPNLTLHHLRRILKGIEGKRIGGEDVGKFFGEGAMLNAPQGKKRKLEVPEGEKKREQVGDENPEDQVLGPGVAAEGEQDGWQDKEDYDLAQEDVGLDTMGEKRHPGAHMEEPADDQEAEDMAGLEIEGTRRKVGLSEQRASKSTADKHSRKKAKKARLREEKRAKEDAKAERAKHR